MLTRRRAIAAAAAATTAAFDPLSARADASAPLRARRLRPGDTVALINPSGAVYERAPYETATLSLRALGFDVREAPHLRARRGHFAGSDEQRAADVNAMFADPGVHGILALTGGSGGHRVLPLIDYAAIRRTPKFFGGFSDVTALLNAVQSQTGLVTFHCPMGVSEWNAYSVESFRAVAMQAQAATLANAVERGDDALAPKTGRITTLRAGRARGRLVGGNLAVLAAMAGSRWWPRFDGGVLFIEEVNEYIYRVDRMLATLRNAGAFDRLAGVVLGAFTNCGPGDGNYGTLTLDEVFDDYFGGLGVPAWRGAAFGHVRHKMTLPVGLEVEIDADAGTLRLLQPAVL